jgi:pyruvate dehydrogenase E2 component (dihydrolipoamide acetyltransferase)
MSFEFRAPRVGYTTTEITINQWMKKEGESVEQGSPLVEITSDKANMEVPAPSSGTLLKIIAQDGEVVPVGSILAFMGSPGEEIPIDLLEKAKQLLTLPMAAQSEEEDVPVVRDRANTQNRRAISPAARRMAEENKVPVEDIEGTGPGKAVTLEDVRRFLEKREEQVHEGETEVLPLSGWRRSMADKMSKSKQTMADATTVAEIDMAEVAKIRETAPATYTAFVIKATAQALKSFPLLNSSLEGGRIILKKRIHMGVSVVTPDEKLLVVVIRHALAKSLMEINGELDTLVRKARNGTVSQEEMSGATFTVTNSGVLGSLLYTPIIDYPQSAILGMGKIADTPVVRDNKIVVRPMMYLCLTYDHRVIDGPTAVRFLQEVKSKLEEAKELV